MYKGKSFAIAFFELYFLIDLPSTFIGQAGKTFFADISPLLRIKLVPRIGLVYFDQVTRNVKMVWKPAALRAYVEN